MQMKEPNKAGVPLLLAGAAGASIATIMGYQDMEAARQCGNMAVQFGFFLVTAVSAGAGGFALLAAAKAFAKPAPVAIAG